MAPGAKTKAPFRTPAAKDFTTTMQKIHTKTKMALEKAADQIKAQYDKKKCIVSKYNPGDKFWLNTTNLHLPQLKKKLTNKQTGPFKVVAKKGASTYILKLPTNWHIHPTFNKVLLTLGLCTVPYTVYGHQLQTVDGVRTV